MIIINTGAGLNINASNEEWKTLRDALNYAILNSQLIRHDSRKCNTISTLVNKLETLIDYR